MIIKRIPKKHYQNDHQTLLKMVSPQEEREHVFEKHIQTERTLLLVLELRAHPHPHPHPHPFNPPLFAHQKTSSIEKLFLILFYY